MENETDKRITQLEQEVRALRLELNELKGIQSEQKASKKNEESNLIKQTALNFQEKELPEHHLLKLNKAAKTKNTNPSITSTKSIPPEQEEVIPQRKEQRSFEELVMWALPKVFMVILVLGVLWGLKLISDYGLLSNTVKIIIAYVLSLALIGIAISMEKRKQDTTQVLTVVLYGGAFIIGILTTAAAAILYDLLGLYAALFIAIVYIAYGIVISYLKKNEVLSIFVVFTSLLLPYLLEYMEFNGVIILLYVVLVYCAMQFVFIKHGQKIANYIAYFFSIIAVQIIWVLNIQNENIYLFAYVILNAILLLVWLRVYDGESKNKAFHEGLLFSLSGLTLFMMNSITERIEIPLLLLTFIFSVAAYIAYQRKQSRIVDVVGTLTLLIFSNILIVVNFISDDIQIILLPLSTFIGLMLGIRLSAILMKITYSVLFTIMIFGYLLINEVEPFWSIEHFNHLLILIYLVGIAIYVKRKTKDNEVRNLSFVNDFFPILIVLYFFIYILKVDFAYISSFSYPYLAILLLSIVMLASFFTPEHYIGRILRYALTFVFILTTINLLPVHNVIGMDIWMNLFVRFVYAIVIIAIIADVFMEGNLYENWIRHLKISIDGFMTAGIVAAMMVIYSLLSQLDFNNFFDSFIVVASKTVLLFATASITLWLSTIRKYKTVRVMGYIVLAIAILKLIFFDLASLNLLIRAILFISIGGIGLFLSNRLLKNASNNED